VSDEVTKKQLAEHDKRLAVVETKISVMDTKIDSAVEAIKENHRAVVGVGHVVAGIEGKIDGSTASMRVWLAVASLMIPFLVFGLDRLFG
jgi:hypothetical protein